MKVIKEAMNNVPEIEDKIRGTVDVVMAKAKLDSEKNLDKAEETIENAREAVDLDKEFDRKEDATFGAEKQPKPEEAEKELEKISLDESLFEESESYLIEEVLDENVLGTILGAVVGGINADKKGLVGIDDKIVGAIKGAFTGSALSNLASGKGSKDDYVKLAGVLALADLGDDKKLNGSIVFNALKNIKDLLGNLFNKSKDDTADELVPILASSEAELTEGIGAVGAAIGISAKFVMDNWDEILNGLEELGLTLNKVDSNIIDIISRHKKLNDRDDSLELNSYAESLNEGINLPHFGRISKSDLIKAVEKLFNASKVADGNQNDFNRAAELIKEFIDSTYKDSFETKMPKSLAFGEAYSDNIIGREGDLITLSSAKLNAREAMKAAKRLSAIARDVALETGERIEESVELEESRKFDLYNAVTNELYASSMGVNKKMNAPEGARYNAQSIGLAKEDKPGYDGIKISAITENELDWAKQVVNNFADYGVEFEYKGKFGNPEANNKLIIEINNNPLKNENGQIRIFDTNEDAELFIKENDLGQYKPKITKYKDASKGSSYTKGAYVGIVWIPSDAFDESLNEDYDSIEEFIDQDMENGNAYWVMGYTANAMKECGLSSEIGEMRSKAVAGNYDNLCKVCQEYINKCNEIANEIDDDYQVEGLEFVTQGLEINEGFSKQDLEDMYLGKKIRINFMINPDSNIDDSKYNGKEGTVESVDDIGQLHGTWGGLAVIPEVDEFEIIG